LAKFSNQTPKVWFSLVFKILIIWSISSIYKFFDVGSGKECTFNLFNVIYIIASISESVEDSSYDPTSFIEVSDILGKTIV